MFENLEEVVRRHEEIERALAEGGLSGQELTRLSKERASIHELVEAFKSYKEMLRARGEAKAVLSEGDVELRELAKEELTQLEESIPAIERKLTLLTLPKDPNDDKNIMLEVRAGTGGEEASLFAADLFRMYTRFAEKAGWRVEILSSTPSASGGYREVIALVTGAGVYSRLKFESGVHRVQRVPTTEAQGRIHTSACTVAILPEAEDVEVHIRPEDLDIMVCRASGAGGQHVNTTDSAVRVVHLPTGLVVECQDERSQHKNKERALKILRSRLYEKMQAEQHAEQSAARRSQVGSGDRSERIRTYNFPQGRVTDHRINLTLYKLADVIDGDIGDLLDALGSHHQTELLKQQLRPRTDGVV